MKKLVKVFEGTIKEFYLDGYLKSNLDIAKKVSKDDWDFCYLVDGKERTGKSHFAQQLGAYLDEDFNIDCITFTPEQFEKRIREAKKNSVVIYDEAFGGLNSRASMTTLNRSLIKMFTEVGYKNLFIIVVLPTFFDLDRYVALWRSRALFHIYTGDGLERGYFGAYNEEEKKKLYILGKKLYDYSLISPNFRGRFTKKWIIDKEKYEERKRNSVLNREKEKEIEEKEEYYFNKIMENEELSHSERIKLLKIPESTYFYRLKILRNEKY